MKTLFAIVGVIVVVFLMAGVALEILSTDPSLMCGTTLKTKWSRK